MSRIDSRIFAHRTTRAGVSTRFSTCEATLVVVEDEPTWSPAVDELCAFLEIRLVCVSEKENLAEVLRDHRPMAVLASMDGASRDGCHVMKLVAAHDPELPVLILTEGDAVLTGAAEAVEELWGLTSVTKRRTLPCPSQMVEFLFRAGQRGRCLGMMPI